LTTVTVADPLIQTGLLGDAIEGAPVAVFVADDAMRYIAVNTYACKLLGYTREEILRLRVSDVARSPEASGEYREMISEGVREGDSVLTRKDGSEVRIHYRASTTVVAGMSAFVSVGWLVG
jgi:PAS domain S-box-containing protein